MNINAGSLRITLGADGRIAGMNRLHAARRSDLLTIERFDWRERLQPTGLRPLAGNVVRLSYEAGASVDVEIVSSPRYARLKIVAASANVAAAFWGPFVTDMNDAPGEIIGLLRGEGHSMGLLSLEPNTDGLSDPSNRLSFLMARCLEDGTGSCLAAETRDRTRDGVGAFGIAVRGEAGRTVVGSAVAIFGCATADELEVIETIELAEGLPHPTRNGQWLKRSSAMLQPSVWMTFCESDVDAAIGIARRMGALSLSSFHDMFGNWGHFDPDPGLWPSGLAGLRAAADRARAAGVELVMYTLTTFLKPHPRPEPYLAPVPDDRLQTMGPATVLAADLDANGDTLILESRAGLLDALRIAFRFGSWIEHHEENQVVRAGNEIIYYRSVREAGGVLILEGCRRGLFHTTAAAHRRGARAVRLYLNEFRNFYPGTLGLQDEVADRIAGVALAGGFGQITLDGHEGCVDTGHGIYSRNRLTRRIYERCGERIQLYTGSNLGNYDWHVMSFMRWGEFDLEKGFRGSMLDYRLMRQVQLRRNLLPHGLGQYYPSEATLEDIEWVMARAAGWDAAVDFTIYPEAFARNPEHEAIMDTVRVWNQAQREGVFSEEQKRGLRQTDRLYTLRRDDGELTFKGRWLHQGVTMLPAAVFQVAGAQPCSIDWRWTHNPGIYVKAGLSGDLVFRGEGGWMVTYPDAERETTDSLQFVLRLAPDAPGAIQNPRVSLDGRLAFTIPVTLQPGQYLSTVHDTPWVCVYDAAHDVIAEAHVQGCLTNLPAITRGEPHRIGLRVDGDGTLILNLRTHEQIKPPPEGGLTDKILTEMNLCRVVTETGRGDLAVPTGGEMTTKRDWVWTTIVV
jgi:hypothetical protein